MGGGRNFTRGATLGLIGVVALLSLGHGGPDVRFLIAGLAIGLAIVVVSNVGRRRQIRAALAAGALWAGYANVMGDMTGIEHEGELLPALAPGPQGLLVLHPQGLVWTPSRYTRRKRMRVTTWDRATVAAATVSAHRDLGVIPYERVRLSPVDRPAVTLNVFSASRPFRLLVGARPTS